MKLKDDRFIVKDSEENMFRFEDIDKNSGFFFNIKEYKKNQQGYYQLFIERCPTDDNNMDKYSTWIIVTDLKRHLTSWLNILEQYDKVESFFDDPIIKSFQEEYFAEFEIMDEETHKKPLTSKQILLIDDYLSKIEFSIDDYKNDSNNDKIDEILLDIAKLRDNLTVNSKYWVLKNLTDIWAKITKLGPKFMKEFVSEANKEIIKQGVRGLINLAKDNLIP
ncbi:MAG TPA: hypothetical protein DEB37_10655 [Lysinibacillus sp.]|nr:hypothetical protein [Lysinibacillus sp.]